MHPSKHYIYKITFLCGEHKGCYYIGKRTTQNSIDNFYTGSGNFCKAYFKKYGKKEGMTYIKEILEINPDKITNAKREEEIIGDLWNTDNLCVNMCAGGWGGVTYERTEYHRRLLSELAKARIGPLNSHFGKKNTPEQNLRISNALKGKFSGSKNPRYGVKVSDEQKIKQSLKMKGRHRVYREDGTWYMSQVAVTEANASF